MRRMARGTSISVRVLFYRGAKKALSSFFPTSIESFLNKKRLLVLSLCSKRTVVCVYILT